MKTKKHNIHDVIQNLQELERLVDIDFSTAQEKPQEKVNNVIDGAYLLGKISCAIKIAQDIQSDLE